MLFVVVFIVMLACVSCKNDTKPDNEKEGCLGVAGGAAILTVLFALIVKVLFPFLGEIFGEIFLAIISGGKWLLDAIASHLGSIILIVVSIVICIILIKTGALPRIGNLIVETFSEKKYVYLKLKKESDPIKMTYRIYDNDHPARRKEGALKYDSSTGQYFCKIPARMSSPMIRFYSEVESSPEYIAVPNFLYTMNGKFEAPENIQKEVKYEPQKHSRKPVRKTKDPDFNLKSLPPSKKDFDIDNKDLTDLDAVVKNCAIVIDTNAFLNENGKSFIIFFEKVKPYLLKHDRHLVYHKKVAFELKKLKSKTYNPHKESKRMIISRCETASMACKMLGKYRNTLIQEYGEMRKYESSHADPYLVHATAGMYREYYQFLFLTRDRDLQKALLDVNLDKTTKRAHKVLVSDISPQGDLIPIEDAEGKPWDYSPIHIL